MNSYMLSVSTWQSESVVGRNRDGSTKIDFSGLAGRTESISGYRNAIARCKDIYAEAKNAGLRCTVIRRDKTGFGRLAKA